MLINLSRLIQENKVKRQEQAPATCTNFQSNPLPSGLNTSTITGDIKRKKPITNHIFSVSSLSKIIDINNFCAINSKRTPHVFEDTEDRFRKFYLLPWETVCSNSWSAVIHYHLFIEQTREGIAPWAAKPNALTRDVQWRALTVCAWKSPRDSRNH